MNKKISLTIKSFERELRAWPKSVLKFKIEKLWQYQHLSLKTDIKTDYRMVNKIFKLID
jgi:hypothetical protein